MVIHAFIFINQRMGKNDPSLQNTTVANSAQRPKRKKLSCNQDSEKLDNNLGLHERRKNAIYSCSARTTGIKRRNLTKPICSKFSF